MTHTRALPLLAALAWAGACGSEPTGVSRIGTLELSGQVTRSDLRAGDTAVIRFRLRNAGLVPITLTFNGGCQILPYIFDSGADSVLYPSSGAWRCTAAITPLTLAPGEERTQPIYLLGVARMIDVQAPVVPLVPGTYYAYARLDHPDYPLQTPQIEIRVH